MRRGRGAAFIAVVLGALTAAPGGMAATPQEICRDLADGRTDSSYTAAELAAYAAALQSDPSVQGYCTPFTPAVTPSETPPSTPPGTPPTTPPATPSTPPATPSTPPTPPTGGVLPGATPAPSPTAAPTSGTAGVEKTVSQPLNQTKAAGVLPFTGTELTIFAIVGLVLLASGLLLRSTARQRP